MAQALQIPFTEDFDVIEPVYEVSKEALAAGTPAEIFEVSVSLMPQIKAAEANVTSAEYGVKIAKGGFLPTLDAGLSAFSNYVDQAFVGKGLCMRRFQARGRSKNGIIKKFFSHLRIVVTEKTVEEGN